MSMLPHINLQNAEEEKSSLARPLSLEKINVRSSVQKEKEKVRRIFRKEKAPVSQKPK